MRKEDNEMSTMRDDIEKVFFTEEQLQAMVKDLGARISEDYAGQEIFAIGILKGAVVFFADLVRAIDVPVQLDFMIASSYGGGTETSGSVKILKDLDYDITGKNVIVIEDIIDSGTTMNYLLGYLKNKGAKSVKLAALFSKPSRRKVDVKIDYLCKEIPDEFIVGYGLDFAEKYRNLPYVGVLKPELYSE